MIPPGFEPMLSQFLPDTQSHGHWAFIYNVNLWWYHSGKSVSTAPHMTVSLSAAVKSVKGTLFLSAIIACTKCWDSVTFYSPVEENGAKCVCKRKREREAEKAALSAQTDLLHLLALTSATYWMYCLIYCLFVFDIFNAEGIGICSRRSNCSLKEKA